LGFFFELLSSKFPILHLSKMQSRKGGSFSEYMMVEEDTMKTVDFVVNAFNFLFKHYIK